MKLIWRIKEMGYIVFGAFVLSWVGFYLITRKRKYPMVLNDKNKSTRSGNNERI